MGEGPFAAQLSFLIRAARMPGRLLL